VFNGFTGIERPEHYTELEKHYSAFGHNQIKYLISDELQTID